MKCILILLLKSLLCLLGISLFWQDCQSEGAKGIQTRWFTFNQISNVHTATLDGRNPSHSFYFPIPDKSWDVDEIHLKLRINFSPILLPSSTLTLMVDETPIKSIKREQIKGQPFIWDIKIPKRFIDKKKVLTISLIGYMKISNEICRDLDNKGNWITISGESEVGYFYNPRKILDNIGDLPYPFVNKNAPFKDKVMFVMPRSPNLSIVGGAMVIANYFARHASWRGVDVDLDYLDSSNKLVKSRNNIVLIASPSMIDMQKLGISLPLSIHDGQWLDYNGNSLSKGTGFAYLATNLNDPDKRILLISANDDAGIDAIIGNISRGMLKANINQSSIYFSKKNIDNNIISSLDKLVTFESLGYKDMVVFGDGLQKLNYQFILYPEFANKPVKLVLKYSHSPFLSNDTESYLMVKVNELPLVGERLYPGNSKRNIVEFDIPASNFKVGRNTIVVTFNMAVKDSSLSCQDLSHAWGTVYDTSALLFEKGSGNFNIQLKDFQYLMNKSVIIGIGNIKDYLRSPKFVKQLIEFAMHLTQAQYIRVIPGSMLDKFTISNNIYIGNGQDVPRLRFLLEEELKEMVANLKLTASKALQVININLFKDIRSPETKVGFVALNKFFKSEPNLTMMILAQKLPLMQKNLELLNTNTRIQNVRGELAVVFNNGTYTSLTTARINQQVAAEIRMNRVGKYTFIGFSITLAVVIALLLIWIVVRQLRNK